MWMPRTIVAVVLMVGTGAPALSKEAPRLPDLVVVHVDHSFDTLIGPQAGVAVENHGTASSGPSLIRIYESTDRRWSANDRPDGSGRLRRLKPGGRSPANPRAVWGLDMSKARKGEFVIACVDVQRAVTEAREHNNCRASWYRWGDSRMDEYAPDRSP
jgi:hypothetical protein